MLPADKCDNVRLTVMLSCRTEQRCRGSDRTRDRASITTVVLLLLCPCPQIAVAEGMQSSGRDTAHARGRCCCCCYLPSPQSTSSTLSNAWTTWITWWRTPCRKLNADDNGNILTNLSISLQNPYVLPQQLKPKSFPTYLFAVMTNYLTYTGIYHI